MRHAAVAAALGAAAALLLPGVTVGAAALVVQAAASGCCAPRSRWAVRRRARPRRRRPRPPARRRRRRRSLGALPGFAATFVIGAVLLVAPWLYGEPARAPGAGRARGDRSRSARPRRSPRAPAPAIMGRVLRDVSALDRQRLATLEIKPPTPIERLIAAAGRRRRGCRTARTRG